MRYQIHKYIKQQRGTYAMLSYAYMCQGMRSEFHSRFSEFCCTMLSKKLTCSILLIASFPDPPDRAFEATKLQHYDTLQMFIIIFIFYILLLLLLLLLFTQEILCRLVQSEQCGKPEPRSP